MKHVLLKFVSTITLSEQTAKKCLYKNCKAIRAYAIVELSELKWGRHGCDRMVVNFTTTCAIGAYHHKSCELKPHSWRGVLDTKLRVVCQ